MSVDLIQRARDIAADTYVRLEVSRTKLPTTHASHEAWGRHIDYYSRFMREGAYDDDVSVQAALSALSSVLGDA